VLDGGIELLDPDVRERAPPVPLRLRQRQFGERTDTTGRCEIGCHATRDGDAVADERRDHRTTGCAHVGDGGNRQVLERDERGARARRHRTQPRHRHESLHVPRVRAPDAADDGEDHRRRRRLADTDGDHGTAAAALVPDRERRVGDLFGGAIDRSVKQNAHSTSPAASLPHAKQTEASRSTVVASIILPRRSLPRRSCPGRQFRATLCRIRRPGHGRGG
jgi:hypothetical protein